MKATYDKNKIFSNKDEAKYQNLKNSIALLLNSLNFHNNRIEALIDQLYGINKAITNLDSSFVKISEIVVPSLYLPIILIAALNPLIDPAIMFAFPSFISFAYSGVNNLLVVTIAGLCT